MATISLLEEISFIRHHRSTNMEITTHLGEFVLPLVADVPEVLVVQLVCLVAGLGPAGPQHSDEARVVATFLPIKDTLKEH